MMRRVLAGDIGGTKTLLQLVDIDLVANHYQLVHQQRFVSGNYADLSSIIQDFINTADTHHVNVSCISACFAIAGPITTTPTKQTANVTNLPWTIDSTDLCNEFDFHRVKLINDFEAVAHGLSTLANDDVFCLQAGEFNPLSPQMVLGAGTGLGVCQLIKQNNTYSVIASEGGHCDFSPNNQQQIELLQYLWQHYDHLSYDRLLSGLGIYNIYSFLSHKHPELDQDLQQQVNNASDKAEKISSSYNTHNLAKLTIDIFIDIYGAQAGNLALINLPYGGVFIAGGIAPKLIDHFKNERFLASFHNKGRMSPLMEKFPIHVVMNNEVGVRGAAVVAATS